MPRRKHSSPPQVDTPRPGSEAAGPDGLRIGSYTLSTNDPQKSKRITKQTEERIARYLLMKANDPELTVREIAERMGIGFHCLRTTLYQATKKGLLTFDSPLDKFKYETMPMVADRFHDLVVANDKQAVIEASKATLFKQYLAEEGIAEQAPLVLGLKIEMVPSDVQNKPAGPQLIGKGRAVKTLDGQVAE